MFLVTIFLELFSQASEAAREGMARAKTEVQKRDLGDRIKARASAMWTSFEQVSLPVLVKTGGASESRV